MGTVVYFVEFMMMSLMGIMLYKLYTSYENWKNTAVFASSTDPLISPQGSTTCSSVLSDGRALSEHDNAELLPSVIPSVVVARALLKKPVVNEHVLDGPINQKNNDQSIYTEVPKAEKKSAAILNDYIGEFFLENQTMDINPYRALEPKNDVPTYKATSAVEVNVTSPLVVKLDEDKSDDEFIKVESLSVVSASNVQPTDLKALSTAKDFLQKEDTIPTLVELSEPDADSFIVVSAANNEVRDGHKVMSDKVVMAMLDEARLVCAS